MKTLSEHWNRIFKKTVDKKLGWYENDFSQILKFLYLIPNLENSKIFIPGVGTSNLIDVLLKFSDKLILNDLSSEAIKKTKNKYNNKTHNIKWLCQDISFALPPKINNIDIWIDRAVLHFLTDENRIKQYFRNVNTAVKSGGYVIFVEFSKNGAVRCAGLDVRRYDISDFEKKLTAFELIASEEYIYINPKGKPKPYIYTLFKKKS